MSQLYQMQLGAVTYIGPAHELGLFYASSQGLTLIHLQAQGGKQRAAVYCEKGNAWREIGDFPDEGSNDRNLDSAFATFFLKVAVEGGVATEFDPQTTIYHLLQGDGATTDDETLGDGATADGSDGPAPGDSSGTDGGTEPGPSEGN